MVMMLIYDFDQTIIVVEEAGAAFFEASRAQQDLAVIGAACGIILCAKKKEKSYLIGGCFALVAGAVVRVMIFFPSSSIRIRRRIRILPWLLHRATAIYLSALCLIYSPSSARTLPHRGQTG